MGVSCCVASVLVGLVIVVAVTVVCLLWLVVGLFNSVDLIP